MECRGRTHEINELCVLTIRLTIWVQPPPKKTTTTKKKKQKKKQQQQQQPNQKNSYLTTCIVQPAVV